MIGAVGLVVGVAVAMVAVVTAFVVIRRRTRSVVDRIEALASAIEASVPAATDDTIPSESAVDVAAAFHRLDRVHQRLSDLIAAEHQSVTRLERAVRAIPQGLVIVDEAGEIVFRNDVAAEFASGRHGDALVEAAIRELVAEAVHDGNADQRTLELFGPPRRTMVIGARPLLADGRAVGALALIEDLTERRRLEAVRRDFVANISHELKTPVGALSLLAETLVDEEDRRVSQRLAERMVNEATRLADTIEDLLVLSRIESEEESERELVPIHLVLAESVTRIRPAANNADIGIDAPDPDHRLAVMGDRRQLVSALYNLLDNAVKYSEEGSEVTVRVSTDGRTLSIAVTDQGIGIPARDLERVFERFYRVDVARSRQTGGTGLGLAIVRHVVSNHAGDVGLDSRLGEGSTFTLSLPLTVTGPVAIDRAVLDADMEDVG